MHCVSLCVNRKSCWACVVTYRLDARDKLSYPNCILVLDCTDTFNDQHFCFVNDSCLLHSMLSVQSMAM